VDRPGVTGTTDIYIPVRRFYPNGWEMELSDAPGTWRSTWDAQREVLSLTTPRNTRVHHVRITLAGGI